MTLFDVINTLAHSTSKDDDQIIMTEASISVLKETLNNIKLIQENINKYSENEKETLLDIVRSTEKKHECFALVLKDAIKDPAVLDDLYTLSLQIENEIAFLYARIQGDKEDNA